MDGRSPDDLSPADAARLARWQAAGRPPIPLAVDAAGQVHATTSNLATLLRRRSPARAPLCEAALRWVDKHCPEE